MNCIRYITYRKIKYKRNQRRLLVDDYGKYYDVSDKQEKLSTKDMLANKYNHGVNING